MTSTRDESGARPDPAGRETPLAFAYVVIGAGPAGVAAARELASRTTPHAVALISDEPVSPYERPPLSKDVLRSEDGRIARIFSAEEAAAIGVTFLGGVVVTRILPDERRLQTTHGDIDYGMLLLATGAAARRLAVPGADLPEVHYLRTEAEARSLRQRLAARPRLVVIGGGFIGLEVAATACGLGCSVDVVTMDTHLMNRCLPAPIAARADSFLTGKGLRIHYGVVIDAVEGTDAVTGVRLSDGRVLAADAVVVGIGSIPNVALATEAGLAVGDGILVDRAWRSSDTHIFAAGDVARRVPEGVASGARGTRLESWEPAIEHGRLAALAMLGDAPEDPVSPWMWSDQFDLNIQITGHPDPGSPWILRERPDGEGFAAAFVEDGRMVGAITLNDGPSMTLLRRAIVERRDVDAALLGDADIPLRKALDARREMI